MPPGTARGGQAGRPVHAGTRDNVLRGYITRPVRCPGLISASTFGVIGVLTGIVLGRILKVLTAQPTGMHTTIMQGDGVSLDRPPCAYRPSNSSPVVSSELCQ